MCRRVNLDSLLVGDLDLGGAGDGRIGKDLVVLADFEDGSSISAKGLAARLSHRIAEGHGTEICEGDQAATLLKILDNPLRVLSTQCRRGVGSGQGLRHLLTGCLVTQSPQFPCCWNWT
jgi:hypothetical protein